MGFHPEFTGRQNAYLAAQLLGFSASEIEALMPEIESFADIGDYMDQPVRVYSSGMQMRVAFSVATARRPDILIVDEALSVGDSHFQHKSFQRIKEFRDEGTTLLLVSHDKAAIQATCDEAILINHGELVMQGKPEVVMNYYNALLSDSTLPVLQRELADGQTQTFSGNGFAKFQKISLLNELEQSIEVLQVGQQARLHFAVQVFQDLPELVLGYVIKDRLGQPVFGTNTHYLNQVLKDLPAGKEIIFDFNFSANIGPGYYSVSVALHSADNHVGDNYEWRDLALFFDVVLVNQSSFVGVSWLPPSLKIT
jgi:lipopolysaccharide transport system ATP-binding protein